MGTATTTKILSQLLAGTIAVIAFTADGLFLADETARQGGNFLGALWHDLGYFTDLSNLLVAIVFAGMALNIAALSNRALVGLTVAGIALVGIAYWTLLGGSSVFGKAGWGDMLAHGFTPVAAPLFWLLFAPKGGLRWGHVLSWTAWPLSYFVYAMVRGLATGTFAYGFLNFQKHGIASTLLTVGIIIVLFTVIGAVLVAIDRGMAGRSARSDDPTPAL